MRFTRCVSRVGDIGAARYAGLRVSAPSTNTLSTLAIVEGIVALPAQSCFRIGSDVSEMENPSDRPTECDRHGSVRR